MFTQIADLRLCVLMSLHFLSAPLRPTTFCLRPCVEFPIMLAYIHFILDDFIPHVLPTICLHCINAVVALGVIRVICGFQVSLLSRVTPTSLASWESSSFEPFIDKESKFEFRL